jgi:peptidoglycan/xylan/chitin deacetylase (PgdA/CDA1 family)
VSGGIGLRAHAAALLDRAGVLDAVLGARRAAPVPTITIVTFHRVAEPVGAAPHDPDVIDATPAQLRRRVETLARVGTPIGMATLLDAVDGGALPPNPVMLTFDDGYRSCRELVLPVLRALGVPATFFIATGFVGAGRLYWWEQIAAIVHAARGRSATLTYPAPLRIDTADPRARRILDDIIKNVRGLDLDRFLAELRAALGVAWSADLEASLAAPLIMTWDDVRALADAGMDVESHTRTHRVLETCDRDALRDELVGSRRDLEAQLGRRVRALSYPVGRPPSPAVRRAVAEAGYRVGLTNAGGVNHVWPPALRPVFPLDRFDLHRQPTDRSQSDAMFLSRLAIPELVP